MTVIVLCNIGTAGVARHIGQAIAKLYVPALSLRTLEVKRDEDPQTTARLRGFLDGLLTGKPSAVMLTKDAFDSLSSEIPNAQIGSASAPTVSCAPSLSQGVRSTATAARYPIAPRWENTFCS
jgi:hypothetical protein